MFAQTSATILRAQRLSAIRGIKPPPTALWEVLLLVLNAFRQSEELNRGNDFGKQTRTLGAQRLSAIRGIKPCCCEITSKMPNVLNAFRQSEELNRHRQRSPRELERAQRLSAIRGIKHPDSALWREGLRMCSTPFGNQRN